MLKWQGGRPKLSISPHSYGVHRTTHSSERPQKRKYHFIMRTAPTVFESDGFILESCSRCLWARQISRQWWLILCPFLSKMLRFFLYYCLFYYKNNLNLICCNMFQCVFFHHNIIPYLNPAKVKNSRCFEFYGLWDTVTHCNCYSLSCVLVAVYPCSTLTTCSWTFIEVPCFSLSGTSYLLRVQQIEMAIIIN